MLQAIRWDGQDEKGRGTGQRWRTGTQPKRLDPRRERERRRRERERAPQRLVERIRAAWGAGGVARDEMGVKIRKGGLSQDPRGPPKV